MVCIKLPNFQILINKKLDQKYFLEFFNDGNSMIRQMYPNISTKAGVLATIENNYRDNNKAFEDVSKYLNDSIPILNKIAIKLSRSLECNWVGIDTVTIVPVVCPVCSRFIEDSKFMLTYNFSKDAMLRICAHEMTHFLYFKKLRELFPNEAIDTEYPSKDWLISEIVAPVVVNSHSMQKIINNKDELFLPNKNMINSGQINIITELYNNEPDLMIFRNKAIGYISKQ